MASAIGETVITAKRYSELFNILLSAVTLGSLPQELDSVTGGAADRIRFSYCKVAFVIGADSGVFPLDPVSYTHLDVYKRQVWMQQFRLQSLQIYNEMKVPNWGPSLDGLRCV